MRTVIDKGAFFGGWFYLLVTIQISWHYLVFCEVSACFGIGDLALFWGSVPIYCRRILLLVVCALFCTAIDTLSELCFFPHHFGDGDPLLYFCKLIFKFSF